MRRSTTLMLRAPFRAMGLIAAIPAVVIYNHLVRVIGSYRAILDDAAAQLLLTISRGQRAHVGALQRAAE